MIGIGGSQTNIKAVITADDRASAVLRGFGNHVGSMGGIIEKGLKTAAIGLAAAGAAATAFGVSSVKAFSDSEDRIAQTNAVLKSTGKQAGVTADAVTKLATSLEKQTKFSDESVRSVENLLLTFTAIGKNIFPQATTTVLDMATALGEDTKSASIQLGKALQDPILGVTALRRVGVNFNKDQQKVIANLVETGHSAKAQQLILKELNKEFGGSAKAAGDTFSGSLAKLKNQLNNVQESMGKVIVERLAPFATKALAAIAAIDWTKVIDTTIAKLREFRDWMKLVIDKVSEVAEKVGNYLLPKFEALWNTIQLKVLPVLMRLWNEVLKPLLPVIGTALVIALGLAVDALNVFFNVVTPIFTWMLDHKWIVLGLAGAFGALALAMKFDAIVAAFRGSMAAAGVAMNVLRVGSLAQLNMALTKFGGFGVVAAAALAAAGIIIDASNKAKKAWDNTNDAISRDSASITAGLQSIKDAADSGKITHAHAAYLMEHLAGHRAGGGAMMAGQPYMVGERGAEIVVPSQRSTVIPNTKVGMGGGTLNFVVNIGMYAGSEQEKRKIAMELLKSLRDVAGARSTTVDKMLGVA